MQAIESVLSQSYDQLEIIVVNDGSIGDDYLNHKYSDNVKQINLKVNQKSIHGYGPGSIRNFGIESSEGEWIAFLDSDDWWDPKKLEISIKYLINGASIVYHDLYRVKKSKQIFHFRKC